MKKINVAALVTVLIFASCMQEMEVPVAEDGEIYAKIEQEDAATKTVLDSTNNVCWCEEDQIVAFMKTSSVSCYQIKEAYVGSDQGYFSEVSSGESDREEWKENVVYYLYSEAVKCEKAETGYNLQIDLPSKQTYTADSFGNHAFPMAAVARITTSHLRTYAVE